jgi:hypothetical protein
MVTLQPILRVAAGAGCLGLWLTTAGMVEADTADDGHAAANLSRLGDTPATALPILLRGSTTGPEPTTPSAAAVSDRGQVASGRRLWTVDQASGDVRACWLHRTTEVGVRVVRCAAGRSGHNHRSFGRAFQP